MKFTFQNQTTGEIHHCDLPTNEKSLQIMCNALSVPNDMQSKVTVIDCEHPSLEHILKQEPHNLTELNFFMSAQDRLTNDEVRAVYAVATGKQIYNTKDLINLSFNAEDYELVTDFDTAVSRYNENIMLSEHGFIFGAEKEIPEIYNGKQFPCYLDGSHMTLAISTGGNTDYLHLPTEESDYQKVLERIGAEHSWDAQIEVETYDISEPLANIALKNLPNLEKLNEQIEQLTEVGHSEFKYLENLVENIGITEPQELSTLTKTMHEFEFFPNIHNAMDYGTHIICDSGRFEYDENLEEYIDFEGYGRDKIDRECGGFTQGGYLIYQGYNQEIQHILSKKLGMEFEPPAPTLDLNLYMPLTVTSWYEEDDYGEYEQSDFEETLSSYDCREYDDEMSDFLQKYQSDLPLERGLMEYYDEKDTVNTKVKSLRFDIETIKGELYGVAKCELHAPLTNEELRKLKDFATGQAADGLGEGFEQHEFNMNGREVNIHLWNSDKSWSIKTEREMGFGSQSQGFSMTMG